MTHHHAKDPLHGVTLEMQVNALVTRFGWAELSKRININCFKNNPGVKSSLKFLRRTPWARAEVEALYLDSLAAPGVAARQEAPFNPWKAGRDKSSLAE
ncbi:VF530 family DNA-binding protein [Pantoea sp. KPR_PJ]|uniref:VF530 family protein n=1 Tax=Pantoea sp. KPR_PJ TaxID=2738375 RepID=UPI00352747FB